MKKLIINNCPACEPVNRLVEDLGKKGFSMIESRLEDYHFHQLYIKFDITLSKLVDIDLSGFTKIDNFLVCDCHWSRIEFQKVD